MAELPRLRRTAPHVERRIHHALEQSREAIRRSKSDRLALSRAGDCVRNLWASVHEVPEDKEIDPRMLVLFEHGNASESHLTALLRRAGFEVLDRDPKTGEQFRVVDCDERASGRLDGLIRDATKSIPETWRLLEIKSANERQFEVLLESGFEAWNPVYVAQVQVYMGLASRQLDYGPITDSLCVVECKNDSRIYTEKIRFDPEEFERLRAQVRLAVDGEVPPARPAAASSQYCGFCKWCVRNEWCWGPTADVKFAGAFDTALPTGDAA
ncbi:MAG TPA: hypothetical protein VGB13_01645 [Candidatus Krumholzibacteria bacterium]